VLRLPPLDPVIARAMIDGLLGRPMLDGTRGQPPTDGDLLADLIDEIDVNPLIVKGDSAIAVDCIMVRRLPTGRDTPSGV